MNQIESNTWIFRFKFEAKIDIRKYYHDLHMRERGQANACENILHACACEAATRAFIFKFDSDT